MPAASGTRQNIVDAVLRIIGQDGIAAVTNRRIAKEAGVSLGSVTYHFATQHDLLRESLLHFVAEETRHFTALADECSDDGLDVRQAVETVAQVAGGGDFDTRRIAPFELYVQAGRDERLRAAAAECFAAYDRLATRILAHLGVPDPEPLAGAVVALVFGQQLRRLATGAPAEDLVDALLVVTAPWTRR
ncbi:TetR/AcrR family transcriptional regulator [Streptomyces sp. NBC_01264]|uniref:TetR/AcrR family transcriptional regulator n=1 Tax=Streptomyces sp. NBC_01264 TaxID=2903804 RepID=UPI00224CDC4F|nr:TetR/AcrR family transcriptional regulator [Streptomyces sp. NBC_01264]MCX4781827.1 TetR family transcriptional regulator [Streptomyces sp. NBC_01264]